MFNILNYFSKNKNTQTKKEEIIEYDYSEYYYKTIEECIKYHKKPILISKKNDIQSKKFKITCYDEYNIVQNGFFDERYEFQYLIVYLKNSSIIKIFPK